MVLACSLTATGAISPPTVKAQYRDSEALPFETLSRIALVSRKTRHLRVPDRERTNGGAAPPVAPSCRPGCDPVPIPTQRCGTDVGSAAVYDGEKVTQQSVLTATRGPNPTCWIQAAYLSLGGCTLNKRW